MLFGWSHLIVFERSSCPQTSALSLRKSYNVENVLSSSLQPILHPKRCYECTISYGSMVPTPIAYRRIASTARETSISQ
eukprot:6487509-Amphidinium_carterae.3